MNNNQTVIRYGKKETIFKQKYESRFFGKISCAQYKEVAVNNDDILKAAQLIISQNRKSKR